MFREFAPDLYEHDVNNLENADLANEWRMTDDALWTSGVVNKSSTLPYHRDGFNFATWSAMPVIRRDMAGGYLHFPEYDFTFTARDGWVSFFPGYKYVHGVSETILHTSESVINDRVPISSLLLRSHWSYAVETAKAKESRTKREDGMAEDLKSGTSKVK